MFNTQEGPRIVQAAGIALAVMRQTKRRWSHSQMDVPPDIELTPEQAALLDEFSWMLDTIYPATVEDDDTERSVSIFACEECGCWGYMATPGTTKPSKCSLNLDCEGQVVRATAATKVKPSGK